MKTYYRVRSSALMLARFLTALDEIGDGGCIEYFHPYSAAPEDAGNGKTCIDIIYEGILYADNKKMADLRIAHPEVFNRCELTS